MLHLSYRSLFTILALLLLTFGSRAWCAEIRIHGIPPKKLDEMVAKIRPRLDFIKSREASTWRADDAAFFLKRLLIRAGYVDAKVEWKLPGGNIITLNATPGPRYFYGKIQANRLDPLTQELLQNYFLQPLVETEIVAAKEAPYIEEYSQKGATNIENYLKSQGYWQAKVLLKSENYNRANKKVNVQLNLTTGPKFTLARPAFRGIPEGDVNTLITRLSPLIGQAAISSNMSKMNAIVKDFYREKGYEFAQIFVEPNHQTGVTKLTFEIQPGKRYKVDKVSVKGQEKTKPHRIRRYFDGLKNLHFDRNKADKKINELLASGAFVSATLKPIPTPEGMLNLEIDVKEAKAKSLRTYAGFGTFEGFILGAAYTDLNLGGNLLKFNARGEVSGRGFLGEASLSEPHFAGEPVQLTLRAYLLQRFLDGYDKTEGGFETSLTLKYLDHYSSRLYFGLSQSDISSSSLSSAELGPTHYLNTRAGFEQTIDFREDPILPSRGFFARGLLEFGSINGDSTTTYQRARFDTSYRFKIGEDNLFVGRFSSGVIFAADSENLPIDLRFFSGGADSVRSFEQRHLGPRSLSNDPLGGEAFWNASFEYIRPIYDPVKGLIFFDMGQVYSDAGDFSGFSNPNYAAGLGFRVDLPVGALRLEYGFNLNRRRREPSGTLHFSIGTSF